MPKVYDAQYLEAYLEHVAYEIAGLISSYIQMQNMTQLELIHPLGDQGVENDNLDLMSLHFRNLYEFFCCDPSKSYLRATHYAPAFKGKANNDLIHKANNQVSHLTEERHRLAQTKESKQWAPDEVVNWLVVNFIPWYALLDITYQNKLKNLLGPIYMVLEIRYKSLPTK